jgi:hypothetical protein
MGTTCNKNVITDLEAVVSIADSGEKLATESLFCIDVNSVSYYSQLIH